MIIYIYYRAAKTNLSILVMIITKYPGVRMVSEGLCIML